MFDYDLSICVPTIRPHYLERLYLSVLKACTEYKFEFVCVGPNELPQCLRHLDNVRYIKDFGSPTRCSQLAILNCNGRVAARVDDDEVFFEKSFDITMQFYDSKCYFNDIISLRYREGVDFSAGEFPINYWAVKTYDHLCKMNIPNHYWIAVLMMTSVDYFKQIGGFDCRFEHIGYAQHDFSYRAQNAGGKVYCSPVEIANIDHLPGFSGDHLPVWEAHAIDQELLNVIYNNGESHSRVIVNINNWMESPPVWERRFRR